MKTMSFGPDDERAFEARRNELVSDFAGWVEKPPLRIDPEDLALLLDWKWGYGDGGLDRWRISDLSDFLLGWCPSKLSATAEEVNGLPATVAMAMSFLADRGLQAADSAPIEQLTEHAVSLQGEFMEKMSDPANFGMAKSIFGQLGIDDLGSLDPGELQRAAEAFNALPADTRRAVTSSTVDELPESLPAIGPIRLPSQEAVRASADISPVLEGFAKLAEYFAAPGRQLTTTGNLKIADAKALVGLLETADVYESEIGGRLFRKRSAADFAELDHWQWWANESGAIRPAGNKMVGVKAWQLRRRKDPIGEVRRAFEVLTAFGPLQSYRHYVVDTIPAVLDQSVGPLFGVLLQERETDYGELLESWTRTLAMIGEPEPYPGAINRSLDQLLMLLERAGLVSQDGVVPAPAQYGDAERSGGTVRLTPVGVAIAIEVLEEQGVAVEILPNPEEMTASDVAALVGDDGIDPVEFWDMTTAWLDVQSAETTALADLIAHLGERSPALVLLALQTAPESQLDKLTPLLRDLALSTDPPPGELGSAAMTWLLDSGALNSTDIDPDVLLDSMLVTFGAFAESDASMVADNLAESRSTNEQLELIAAVGRRLPPRAVALLEAIGSHRGDKVVAKAARKELFRVRSKLDTERRR